MFTSDEEDSAFADEMIGDEDAATAIRRVARARAAQPTEEEARASWRALAVWGPCALLGALWTDNVAGLFVGGIIGCGIVWLLRRMRA